MVLLLLFLASVNACHGEYYMIKWDHNKINFGNTNDIDKNRSDSDYTDEQSQGCSVVVKFSKEILCVKG